MAHIKSERMLQSSNIFRKVFAVFEQRKCAAILLFLIILSVLEAYRVIDIHPSSLIISYLFLIVYVSFIRGVLFGVIIVLVALVSINYSMFVLHELPGDISHMLINSLFYSALFPLAALSLGSCMRNIKNSYEAALQKNKEMYQLLVENQNDLIVKVDASGRFLYASPSYCKLFDKTESELLGSHFIPLVHEEDREKTDAAVKKLYEPPYACYVEQRALTKEGWRWISWIGKAVLDERHTVVSIIASGRDITSQKLSELELNRANIILKAQQEAAVDGILVVDKDRKVISYNRRFLELWGIPEQVMEFLDSNVLIEFVKSNIINSEEFTRRVMELYTNPTEYSNEKIYLTNGRILDRYSSPILSSDRESYGRVWFFRDITEQEETDSALRSSVEQIDKLLKEMMEYDQLKSEFFSNISHEFRTPINVILGTLQLIELKHISQSAPISSDMLKKHTKIMKQNCYRLLKLTNNLIDVTKLEAGYFEINLNNYNIVQVVEDITLSVDEYIENMGITLEFDTNTEEMIMAIDADMIERIMLNLLSNAIKFTPRGGTIAVHVKSKGESIDISVRDTGAGIPADRINIIFERFRQVNSSLTRNHEGSGIGLSLVKNLVKLHGGEIRVSSQYGEGTEFLITLPVRLVNKENAVCHLPSKKDDHVQRISLEFSDIYS